MPLDLHPIYHTETMVKILRDQGSPQLAMELAEQALERNPGHAGVERILSELREEARRAFERFKNSGRGTEDEAGPSALEISAAQSPVTSEDGASGEAPYADKVLKLQKLLDRAQPRQTHDEETH